MDNWRQKGAGRLRIVGGWILAALWLVFVSVGFGQDKPLKQVESDSSFRTFQVLAYGNDFFEGIRFEAAKDDVRVLEFQPDRRSRTYRIPLGVDRLEFYREVEVAGRRSLVRQVVGSVEFEDDVTSCVIVFFSAASGLADGEKYSLLVLDESPEVWGKGRYRFLNLTSTELACTVGGARTIADYGASEILDLSEYGPSETRVQVFARHGSGVQMIYSTRTRPGNGDGCLLVIKPPVEEGSLRIRVENLW